MGRSAIGWGAAGVVLVCAGTVLAARRTGDVQARELAEQRRALAALEARLASLAPSADDEARRDALTELRDELDAMRLRLSTLEATRSRLTPRTERRSGDAAETSGADGDASATERAPRSPSSGARSPAEELGELLARAMGPTMELGGSSEDRDRFWELVKTTGAVDERMEALEALVAADPTDTARRLELADTYIAKLYSVPGGPEQGRWGSKAEEQWRAVVELDPENWEACFAIANSLSYYPDVMGKTGEAIDGFRRAREIQERSVPAPEHVQTYLSLARLLLRTGEREEAREVVESGLRHHPGDASLAAMLAELEGR